MCFGNDFYFASFLRFGSDLIFLLGFEYCDRFVNKLFFLQRDFFSVFKKDSFFSAHQVENQVGGPGFFFSFFDFKSLLHFFRKALVLEWPDSSGSDLHFFEIFQDNFNVKRILSFFGYYSLRLYLSGDSTFYKKRVDFLRQFLGFVRKFSLHDSDALI